MRFQKYFLIVFILTGLIFSACTETPKESPKPNNTVANVATNAGTNPAKPNSPKPETAKENEGQTVSPLITAYNDARVKKDDAALRKLYSAEALKDLDAEVKAEKSKNLTDYLESYEPQPYKPLEIRNEKIEGETAIAELKGGSLGNWTKKKFIKVNGEWKFAPTKLTENLNDAKQSDDKSYPDTK